MTADARDIVDQAIQWHVRRDAMTAEDWHAFILWMEADPAHPAAYDRIAADDDLLDWHHVDDLGARAANDDAVAEAPARRRRAWLAGGALAAAAACAALLLPGELSRPASPYAVATAAGERRAVALADGTRIEMSGGTRLLLDRADPRRAELTAGEATFHVRHDARDPFTLRSGGLTVRDLGTVFNVARSGPHLSVQVAEGSVLFQPDREAVTLKAGSAVSALADGSRVVLSRVDVATVGGWRDGRLGFDAAPLGEVVDAVERHSGVPIAIAAALASRPFTGMVRLTGDAAHDVPHMAALMGARARRYGEGWMVEPLEDAAH